MNHNDYIFSTVGEFEFPRQFEDMYKNCVDPHGQSKELQRIDYQIVLAVLDRAIRALGVDRRGHVLDVGCGLGYFTSQMQAQFVSAEVSGCDISTTAIQKAVTYAPHCRFYPVDLKARATLPDLRYDILVALHVLAYFTEEEITGVISNLRQLLDVGGLILVGHHLPKPMNFGRYMQSIDDARALFKANGFTVRFALDIDDQLDADNTGSPLGHNIYFLAQKVSVR